MEDTSRQRHGILRGVHVLDGGMASELEYRGANIDGPLWSAHVLEDAPEKIAAVHRTYIEAGAECIETASYQVSRMGYAECGMRPERADAALLRAVELARGVASDFPERRVVVAASLGPYGAALHNGAEYHGNYDCGFDELVRFHRERIEVFARATGAQVPDLLAFETFPSLDEARAVCEAIAPWPELHPTGQRSPGGGPGLRAWFSFSCRDAERVAHGERLRECVEVVARLAQTVAIGVNCTAPKFITALISELRAASDKPIIVYPNSGEGWDSARRCWTGVSDPADFGARAAEWFKAGAQIVGGCCRTRPAHIREVAQAAANL